MASPSLPAVLLLLAFPAQAAGSEPVLQRVEGGWMATVVVPSAPDVVRAALADVGDPALRSRDVISMEITPHNGCQEVRGRTRGLSRPLTYHTLRCPTATGYRETLQETGDYKQFESEWRIDPVEEGSRVSFRTVADPDLPVPRALVLANMKRSTLAMVNALVDQLAGGR